MTDQPDPASARLVRFLEARRKGESIAAIARAWGLTREHLSRSVGHQAIVLVTERVLVLNRGGLSSGQSNREPVHLPTRSDAKHLA